MKELNLHPLTNQQDSPHYQEPVSEDSESAIERFERDETVSDLMAWAKISKRKYTDPGRAIKGQQEADVRKAKTYQDYYEMLRDLVALSPSAAEMTAQKVYQILNIQWRYR